MRRNPVEATVRRCRLGMGRRGVKGGPPRSEATPPETPHYPARMTLPLFTSGRPRGERRASPSLQWGGRARRPRPRGWRAHPPRQREGEALARGKGCVWTGLFFGISH